MIIIADIYWVFVVGQHLSKYLNKINSFNHHKIIWGWYYY